jgi:predicted nucleic acid-binding protein
MILKLGEAQVLAIRVSPDVLRELEGALRRKAHQSLGALALLLDRSNVRSVRPAAETTVDRCQELVHYSADALVLAAAWEADAHYFVTLDREHFLSNEALRAAVTFPIGTPGDFLAWFRSQTAAKQ